MLPCPPPRDLLDPRIKPESPVSPTLQVDSLPLSHQGNPFHVYAAAAKSLQSCPTLCNSIDGSPPGSSVHGTLQARVLEWVAVSPSKGSSQTRDQTHVSCGSCIAGRFFTTESPGDAQTLIGSMSIPKPSQRSPQLESPHQCSLIVPRHSLSSISSLNMSG